MLPLVKLQAKAYNKAVVWLSHMVSESVKGTATLRKKGSFGGLFEGLSFITFLVLVLNILKSILERIAKHIHAR